MKDVKSDQAVQVFYHTNNEDFIVWASSLEELNNWRKDSSIPMVEVVQLFKVFVTMKQGSQGVFHEASDSQLENAFSTKNEDEIIKKILKEGEAHVGKTLKGDESQNNFKSR